MSVYGYINCHDCKQSLWLGKALYNDHIPFAFHVGNENVPNWNQLPLNKVIWKFIADHTAHKIGICLEYDMTDEMYEYQFIGGERENDISFVDYLSENEFYESK